MVPAHDPESERKADLALFLDGKMLHGKGSRVIVLCRFILKASDLPALVDRHSDRFHIPFAEHCPLEGQTPGIDRP